MTAGTITEIGFSTLAGLLALYRAGEASPVEIATRIIERIERFNPQLNAYFQVAAEGALMTAWSAEAAYLAGNAARAFEQLLPRTERRPPVGR